MVGVTLIHEITSLRCPTSGKRAFADQAAAMDWLDRLRRRDPCNRISSISSTTDQTYIEALAKEYAAAVGGHVDPLRPTVIISERGAFVVSLDADGGEQFMPLPDQHEGES